MAVTSSGGQTFPGAQLWVKRYSGPGNGFDGARAVAVSPGGGRVFMSGRVPGPPPARTTPPSPTAPPRLKARPSTRRRRSTRPT